jgi:acyl-[acyl-carrier-protein] desaturase
VQLEELRMLHMTHGYDSGNKTPLQALAYVSFQELATRVSHRNTGRIAGCPLAEQLLQRIAADENLHMVFYRNLLGAAFDIAPDATMAAVRDEIVGFQMPGIGMPDFTRNSVIIAKAGIYDLQLHYESVILPNLKFWGVFERNDLTAVGELARVELQEFLEGLQVQAQRFVEQRARAAERDKARAEAGRA